MPENNKLPVEYVRKPEAVAVTSENSLKRERFNAEKSSPFMKVKKLKVKKLRVDPKQNAAEERNVKAQAEFDKLMGDMVPESHTILQEMAIEKEAGQMMKLSESYFEFPSHPKKVLDLLRVRDFLASQANVTITISFSQWAIIAPFYLAWYRREHKFKPVSRKKVVLGWSSHHVCRSNDSNKRKSVEAPQRNVSMRAAKRDCKHRMKIIVDYNAQTVKLEFEETHNHPLGDLSVSFRCEYLRSFAFHYCKAGFVDISAIQNAMKVSLKAGLNDVDATAVWEGTGLPYLPRETIRHIRKLCGGEGKSKRANENETESKTVPESLESQPLSPDKEYNLEIERTVRLLQSRQLELELEAAQMHKYRPSETYEPLHEMLIHQFKLADGTPSFLIADKAFFKDMVYQNGLVQLGCSKGICSFANTRLYSVGYRDENDEMQIAAAALLRTDGNEADLTAFFRAVVDLAGMDAEDTPFLKLLGVLVPGSSPAETAAVKAVFDWGPKVFYSQSHVEQEFRSDLAGKLGGTLYRLMMSAMSKDTAEECKKCVDEACKLVQNANLEDCHRYIRSKFETRELWASYPRYSSCLLLQIRDLWRMETLMRLFKLPPGSGGIGLGENSVPPFVGLSLSQFFEKRHMKRSEQENSNKLRACSIAAKYPEVGFLKMPLQKKLFEQFIEATAMFNQMNGAKSKKKVAPFPQSLFGNICACPGSTRPCEFNLVWALPCKHIFLAAQLRGDLKFAGTYLLLEPFGRLGVRAYDIMKPVSVIKKAMPKKEVADYDKFVRANKALQAAQNAVSASVNDGINDYIVTKLEKSVVEVEQALRGDSYGVGMDVNAAWDPIAGNEVYGYGNEDFSNSEL